MPTILMTGAASGLGAAFLSAYKQDKTNTIIAIDKQKIDATATNVEALQVDITSSSSLRTLSDHLKDSPLDLIIHSAGIRGLVPAQERQTPNDVAACETVDVMDAETLSNTFQVNTVGTFLLLQTILPSLRKNAESGEAAKVIIMSSRMGSISNNQHPNKDAGSAYAYRASKAALNQIVRSFAADFPEVIFVLCHPGRVETKLVKCREKGAISAEKSVSGLLPLIGKWGKEDSGKFYDRFGEVIPW